MGLLVILAIRRYNLASVRLFQVSEPVAAVALCRLCELRDELMMTELNPHWLKAPLTPLTFDSSFLTLLLQPQVTTLADH